MLLYLTLLLSSLAIPLILSFDRKVAFYKCWNTLLPAILFTGSLFIAADIIFTRHGFWGFNSDYHLNFLLLGIPVEEWLFFVIIPYASIFIHYVYISYFPQSSLSDKTTRIITLILIFSLVVIMIFAHEKAYTLLYSAVTAGILIITLIRKEPVLNRFYISFLIILVPFFLINGILTGSFIPGEVVWYNESEISGYRIGTVPVEDILYGFSLILLNLLIMDLLKRKQGKEHNE